MNLHTYSYFTNKRFSKNKTSQILASV